MRSLIIACLWLCISCKSTVRAPVSDLQAVTDGRVTLGVVASENEEGLQAYRLLLCRNQADYHDAQVFANSNMCLPALVDSAGQEVVIFPDRLRRPFGVKIANYAKIAVGVVLAAGAGYGGYKWFTKSSKYLKNLEEVAEDAYKTKVVEIKKTHQNEIDEIRQQLDGVATKDFDNLIDNELPQAFKQADAEEVEKVLTKLEKYTFTENGEFINFRDIFEREFPTKEIDAELLQNFSQNIDEKIAAIVQQARYTMPFQTNINDIHYFHSRFFSSKKQFDQTVRAKLQELVKVKTVTPDLTDEEKIIMLLTEKHAIDYETALHVHVLHQQRELLLKFKKGDMDLESLEKLATDDYKQLKLSVISELASRDFLGQGEVVGTWASHILGKIDYLPSDVKEVRKSAAFEANMRVREFLGKRMDDDLDAEIAMVSEQIDKLNYGLMRNVFNSQIEFRTPTDGEFDVWRKIKAYIDAAPIAREKIELEIIDEIASLKNKTEIRKLQLQADVHAEAAVKNMREGDKKLYQLLLAQEEKSVARMEEALHLAETGKKKEAAAIVKRVEEERTSALGLAIASALGSATVLATIDKSIWGYGEKQLGGYWSQIFNAKASFATAAAVDDMQTILTQLAKIFGHQVNAAALQLIR